MSTSLGLLTMEDVDLHQRRVLIREDLNVPMQDGKITNDERIQRALPTIKQALASQAKVMVMSHLGRPKEGEYDEQYSLAPVADALQQHLGVKVKLVKHWLDGVAVEAGEVVLCENVRFNQGEAENAISLATKMAALCDVFVMDAFATAHREQASTCGVAKFAPIACAGPLLIEELKVLHKVFVEPKRPVIAIVGGSKVSTKIKLLTALVEKVDVLIVGGGIANTFLKSQGYEIGQSLYESSWVAQAAALLKKAKAHHVAIPLPQDVVVANKLSADAIADTVVVEQVQHNQSIFDIGPLTIERYNALIDEAATIIWNGPVGVFEIEPFSQGTRSLAKAVARSKAYSVVGGGDTVAAIEQFNVADKVSYVSTGGGAFLTFMQGEALPAVKVLQAAAVQSFD